MRSEDKHDEDKKDEDKHDEDEHDDHGEHGDHSEHDDKDEEDTLILRIVAVFASAASTAAGLALFFPKRSKALSEETMLCIRAGSGGTMISVAIVHILSEAAHQLEFVTPYPLAGTIFLIGCLFAYAFDIFSSGPPSDHAEDSHQGQELTTVSTTSDGCVVPPRCCPQPNTDKLTLTDNLALTSSKLSVEGIEFGCSVHCFLLGLSLGMQTNMSSAIVLFVVMVIHQMLEAACLGHLLASLKSRTEGVVLCLLIIGAMPIGIIIGLIISEAGNSAEAKDKMKPYTASVSCIAGGMLLYSSLIGLLSFDLKQPSVQANKNLRYRMIASALLGAAAMSALSAGELAGGEHDHR